MDDSEEMWLDKAEEEYLEKKHYNCPKCLCDDPSIEETERDTGACGDPECCGPATEEVYHITCPTCGHFVYYPMHFEIEEALEFWSAK